MNFSSAFAGGSSIIFTMLEISSSGMRSISPFDLKASSSMGSTICFSP